MQYNKKHINYFLVITLFVLSQDLYGTNYLKNVSFQGKENGLIIEFVFEGLVQSTLFVLFVMVHQFAIRIEKKNVVHFWAKWPKSAGFRPFFRV